MERVLPPYILSNWKLLREKVTATVLVRGILIPHPREDYDLLEERLLETLELRMPRILACGHFHLDADEEADLLAAGEEVDDEDDDVDMCTDCGRRIRDGRHGSGMGSRRWDIKIYAANGLMRAGAWGAAWREMERVDVEICPWVSEELKRELESAREAEEQDDALRQASEEETTQDIQLEEEIPTDQGPISSGLDDARIREIYGDGAEAYMDGLHPPHSPAISPKRSPRQHFTQSPPSELPLSTLLSNYLTILARDPRNVAIAILGLLVLVLAIVSKPSSQTASVMPSPSIYMPQGASSTSYVTDAASQASSSMSSITPLSSVTTAEPAPAEETFTSDQGQNTQGFVDELEVRLDFD